MKPCLTFNIEIHGNDESRREIEKDLTKIHGWLRIKDIKKHAPLESIWIWHGIKVLDKMYTDQSSATPTVDCLYEQK